MKVTIEFSLPEERDDMEYAIKGHDASAALAELDNDLRALIKYNTELSDEFIAGLQKARDLLHQHTAEREIHL